MLLAAVDARHMNMVAGFVIYPSFLVSNLNASGGRFFTPHGLASLVPAFGVSKYRDRPTAKATAIGFQNSRLSLRVMIAMRQQTQTLQETPPSMSAM